MENDSEDFVSDSIFKRLKFDYSSSETVSNKLIELRASSYSLCITGDQTNLFKSIITKYNAK